jgi:hypothetical protein
MGHYIKIGDANGMNSGFNGKYKTYVRKYNLKFPNLELISIQQWRANSGTAVPAGGINECANY